MTTHTTTVKLETSNYPGGDPYYAVTCTCGWTRTGYEYRLQADRAARTHAAPTMLSTGGGTS